MEQKNQVFQPRIKVDLRVMTMKELFQLPRSSELELHHQIQFSIILRTTFFFFPFFCGVALFLCREYSQQEAV